MSENLTKAKFINFFKHFLRIALYALIVVMVLLVITIRWLDISLAATSTGEYNTFLKRYIQAQEWTYHRQKNRISIQAKQINSNLLNYEIKINKFELNAYLFAPFFANISGLQNLANKPNNIIIQSASIINKTNPTKINLKPSKNVVQALLHSKQQLLSSHWGTLLDLKNSKLNINNLNLKLPYLSAEIDTLDFNNSINTLATNGHFKVAQKDYLFEIVAKPISSRNKWQTAGFIKHNLTNERHQLTTAHLEVEGEINIKTGNYAGKLQLALTKDRKTKLLLQSLTKVHQSRSSKNAFDIKLYEVKLNQKSLSKISFNLDPYTASIKLLSLTDINLTTLEALNVFIPPLFSNTKLAGNLLLSELEWQLKLPYPTKIHAEIKNANISSTQHNFSVKNLNLVLASTPKPQHFTWKISADNLLLDLPDVYKQPITLHTKLTGNIIQNNLGKWLIYSQQQQFIKGIFTKFNLKLDLTSQANNSFHVQVKASKLSLKSYIHLIPNNLESRLLDWLKKDFLNAEIETFNLNYQPQHINPAQRLKIELTSKPGTFSLMPNFPDMLRKKAILTFNQFPQPTLKADVDTVTFVDTQFSIPKMMLKMVKSNTSGTSMYIKFNIPSKKHGQKVLQSFRLTPIPKLLKIEKFFDNLDYKGKLAMALNVSLPLNSIAEKKSPFNFNLDLEMLHASISYKKVLLENFSAKFKIDRNSIQSNNIKTQLKNNYGIFDWVSAKILPQNSKGKTQIILSTIINSEKISPFLQGSSALTSILSFSSQSFNTEQGLATDPFTFKSNTSLLGINSYLPNQLSKSASTTMPLSIDISILGNSQNFELTLGKIFNINATWKEKNLRYAHASIGGAKQPFAKDGIYVTANIPVLRYTQWQPIFTRGILTQPLQNFLQKNFKIFQNNESLHSLFFRFLSNNPVKLITINVNSFETDILDDKNLNIIMRPSHNTVAKVIHPTHDIRTYTTKIYGDNNQGTLLFNKHQVNINFDRLHLKQRTNFCAPIINPIFKSLNANITKLTIDQSLLGKVSFKAKNTFNKLQVPKMYISNKGSKISLTNLIYHYPTRILSKTESPHFLKANWKNLPISLYNYGRTEANIELQSSNSQSLQEQFNFNLDNYQINSIRATGNIKFYGGFIGCIKPKNIEGAVKVSAQEGAAQNLKVGFARILEVINARTIFNRLTSSAQKAASRKRLEKFGTYFKELKGELSIKNGLLNVKSFSFNSPVARVNIKGNIDTEKEAYDLKAKIKPTVTDAFITVATLLKGPIIGFFSYIVVRFVELLGLDNLFTYQMDIKGDFDKSAVEPESDG